MADLQNISTLLLAFVGVWVGAALAITPIDKIAKRLNRSSFIVSFFVLGIFTSLSEISIAINAYIEKDLNVTIGNLLGSALLLFIFVIPLLGLLANGVKLNNDFGMEGIFLCIIFLMMPHILLLDKNITTQDSAILLLAYICLATYLYLKDKRRPKPLLARLIQTDNSRISIVLSMILIIIGSVILIFSSNYLVEGVIDLGTNLNISPFAIALVGLSFGTNFPEISLAIVAALRGKAEVGLGNYLGSATFNPMIMSLLGLASGGFSIHENFTKLLIFSALGFFLFFLFIRSKYTLSRRESVILIFIYVFFIISELLL